MGTKIHQTKDGSSTLYSEEFNQFYHNPNGAASESLHVFFETPGLIKYLESAKSLTILEIGFGTGLNFLLLLDILQQRNLNIPTQFHSVEAFPIPTETAQILDFSGHLRNPELGIIIPEIFSALKPGFNHIKPLKELSAELHLFIGTFEAFNPADLKADFIFHDPFSPEVNRELWSANTFAKIASYSKPTTILGTYCAASKARGAMCAAGWHVAKAQGALGKREMTLASQDEKNLNQFKRVNEKKLAERYLKNDFK